MLNFVNERVEDSKPSWAGISRKPAIAFGVSADTPTQFVSNHTMLNTQTHAYSQHSKKHDKLRLSGLPGTQRNVPNIDWTRKTNINLVEQERVINKDSEYRPPVFHDMHRQELAKRSSRFHLTKGEFTNFLHTQRKNEVLGPLEGPQRTLDRARQTRKSILQQSISSLEKLKSNPSLLSALRTSTIWEEKRRLRKSRENLRASMQAESQSRRYSKSPEFLLPKVRRSEAPRNKHAPTQSESLCSNYLNEYFRTIDPRN